MKEQIIQQREETKLLYQNIAVLAKATEDLEKLGKSKEHAITDIAKIMGIRSDAVLRLLDQPNNPSPRGNYAKVIKKLHKFASAYEETGGFNPPKLIRTGESINFSGKKQ